MKRLAPLGAGLIGREQAALIKRHPGAELAAIADTSAAAREHVASLGIPVYSDYAAMLDEIRPDGAIVALPNHLHVVRGFVIEDTASVALRFERGVLGTFSISDAAASPWSWEFTSAQALYFPHQPGAYLFLGGRKASLSVSDMYLWRHAEPGGHWQDPLVREHKPLDPTRAYVSRLEHFLAVVAGTAAPAITARDGMPTLAATLAIATSAREDRTVTVRELAAL